MINYFSKWWDKPELESDLHNVVANHFMSLRGLVLDYYGTDEGEHTFNVDGVVFKVYENPDDGYRSHLGPIDYSGALDSSIFFKQPIAKVRIEDFDDKSPYNSEDSWSNQLDQGYRLTDILDGHVWLEFGTGNYDDYYPYFMFRHYPKKSL